jgi:hypothetical protein
VFASLPQGGKHTKVPSFKVNFVVMEDDLGRLCSNRLRALSEDAPLAVKCQLLWRRKSEERRPDMEG